MFSPSPSPTLWREISLGAPGKPNVTLAIPSDLLFDADGSVFLFQGGTNFPGIYSYETLMLPSQDFSMLVGLLLSGQLTF